MITRRGKLGYLLTVLTMAMTLVGCGIKETEVVPTMPLPSPIPSQVMPLPVIHQATQPTIQPSPTPIVLKPLFDARLDIKAAPIKVPLKLKIPSLKVNAPVLGVGLNSLNEMDAPKGPIDDPVWHSAFWYRGSGLPGESGTATIAGHLSDSLGREEIFTHLEDLQPGDIIIISYTELNIDFTFTVDQVEVYSLKQSSDPAVLAQIYGTGPVNGTTPQPSLDGLSHLTLITCAGRVINGRFDHHVVVYATLTK